MIFDFIKTFDKNHQQNAFKGFKNFCRQKQLSLTLQKYAFNFY